MSEQELMTAAELGKFVKNALKMGGFSFTARFAYEDGTEPVTDAFIMRERNRLSRVMRDALAPGSPAGPELQNQVLTARNEGWRAWESWKAGVRPEGYRTSCPCGGEDFEDGKCRLCTVASFK